METVCDLVMLFGIICIAALLARAERTIGTIRERHNNSLELLLFFFVFEHVCPENGDL